MKVKYLIIILIGFMNINLTYAQTDEAFLAEAFFGELTENSPKVYIVKDCGVSSMNPSRPDIDSKIFHEKLGITDTSIVNELHEYCKNASKYRPYWNPEATVFQSAKYKPLKFITSEEAGKLDIKGKNVIYIDKPLFTKNHEYALVSVTRYTYHKYSWKYRLRVKPWKNIWKAKYECNVASYNMLFKNNNGKWEKVGQYLTEIS